MKAVEESLRDSKGPKKYKNEVTETLKAQAQDGNRGPRSINVSPKWLIIDG